jgi:hypothetical protein
MGTNGSSAAESVKKFEAAARTPAIGASVGANVIVDKTRTVEVPGGQLVFNDTTGAQHWLGNDGERMEIVPAREPTTQPEPEKPKAIAGKLVTGEDGVRRFVPDDEKDGGPLDLTKALEEHANESRLTTLQKAVRDVERRREKELKAIEAQATDQDKIAGLMSLVDQLQKQRSIDAQLKARYEATILGQSILLAQAQIPNQ